MWKSHRVIHILMWITVDKLIHRVWIKMIGEKKDKGNVEMWITTYPH